jgi:glycosyltransferase involved in cell wall biosynthesis
VDRRFSPKLAPEIDAVRRLLGIRSPAYALCVGSLEPRKNLRRLLEAWTRVHACLPPEVELVVAGDTGSSLVFESVPLGVTPPRVHFTGYVSDRHLPCLYAGALALIYPSLYEGFGLPPLEAMACGTPVITSNTTSLPEVVGDAAVLVDPQDVESIAIGLRQVLSSSSVRSVLRERGLVRARAFTWERTAEQTLELLLSQSES